MINFLSRRLAIALLMYNALCNCIIADSANSVPDRVKFWEDNGVIVTGQFYSPNDVDRYAGVIISKQDWASKGVQITEHCYSVDDVNRIAGVILTKRDWTKKGIEFNDHCYSSEDVNRIAQVIILKREWSKKWINISDHCYSTDDVNRVAQVITSKQKWASEGVQIADHCYCVDDVNRKAQVIITKQEWAKKGVYVTEHCYGADDVEQRAIKILVSKQSDQRLSESVEGNRADVSSVNDRDLTGQSLRQELKLRSTTAPPIAENGDLRGFDNDSDGRAEPVHVRGYFRKDGTYVRGHYRALPRK